MLSTLDHIYFKNYVVNSYLFREILGGFFGRKNLLYPCIATISLLVMEFAAAAFAPIILSSTVSPMTFLALSTVPDPLFSQRTSFPYLNATP